MVGMLIIRTIFVGYDLEIKLHTLLDCVTIERDYGPKFPLFWLAHYTHTRLDYVTVYLYIIYSTAGLLVLATQLYMVKICDRISGT